MQIAFNIIGWFGAVFISIAFLPQTIKIIKTKETKNLALTSYIAYHLGLTFFVIYGFYENNMQVAGSNIFAWIVNAILIFLIIYNQQKHKKDFLTQKE